MGYDARRMLIRVGQNSGAMSVSRYGKHLDLLEVRLDSGVPRKRTLEAMKRDAPANLVFAVVAPRAVSALEGEATEAEVAPMLEVARQLSARWLVVRTPPTARPGSRTRARLTRLIELLKPASVAIAWEPSGLLAEAEAEGLAATLGVTLARDPGRDDLAPGPVAYGRIQSLGAAGRVRGSAIERAAERLQAFDEAYVMIEGQNALRAARDLRALLSANGASTGALSGLDDEDDDEDSELDESDESDEEAAGEASDAESDADDADEDADEDEDEDEDEDADEDEDEQP